MWQLHGCPPLQKIMSGRLQSLVSLSKCVQRGALKIKVFHISLLYFTGTLFWRSGENLNACWDNQAARQQVVFFVFFLQCPYNVKKPSHSIIECNEADATWIWLRCRSRHHRCTWVLTHIGRSFGIQIGELGEPHAEGDIILIRFQHRNSSVE